MKVGTKSVLFGAHCFLIHPFFVMAAWIKLYGFPLHPAIWLSFFFHDLGYWGKLNMDGEEGETHVEFGAKVIGFLFDRNCTHPDCYKRKYAFNIRDYNSRNTFANCKPTRCKECYKWYMFSLYHSRFYAKKDGVNPSRLCIADKLAICLEPYWLYLPRVNWSGEIKEYMKLSGANKYDGEPVSKYESMKLSTKSQKDWYIAMTTYLLRWVEEHKDGKTDSWTPEIKKAIDSNGVWK